ncbi:hypothetical protein XELAEV_18039270mg [Xenopus laevis]|uniref:Uncharacterized protein n=1 Tax=Xenopus laevis TaxID=8355 RepID=A0A974C7H7_XENLA|nr:hypothetical protein XELAEV_18039270mg [Xenopus laevis]
MPACRIRILSKALLSLILGQNLKFFRKKAEGLTQNVTEDVECTSHGSHQANTDQVNGKKQTLENDINGVATKNVSAHSPVEDGEKSFADGGGAEVLSDMPGPSPKEPNQADEEINPEMEQDIAAPTSS